MTTAKPFQEPTLSEPSQNVCVEQVCEDCEVTHAFDPIFDAHETAAMLYDSIPTENKWKRLAMRKAISDPRVIKAEIAIQAQCEIIVDTASTQAEKDLAGQRIIEGMQYWQQLIIGMS